MCDVYKSEQIDEKFSENMSSTVIEVYPTAQMLFSLKNAGNGA